jgi:protein TonB
MKNQPVERKSETLEDIVFEGRNKAYGAYELNRKREKAMILAFFIALLLAVTAIAVPIINAQRTTDGGIIPPDQRIIEIRDLEQDNPMVPLPPPAPPIDEMERSLVYTTPVIVENADPDEGLIVFVDALDNTENPSIDMPIEPVDPGTDVIDDPVVEEIVLFPQENARFMGGDVNEFRKWVVENITYPTAAIEVNIFGKVLVEFCVNSKGEVVDLKLLRKLDPLIDEVTLQVISSSPRWTPAKQGGRPVKQRFVIPFMFDLQ